MAWVSNRRRGFLIGGLGLLIGGLGLLICMWRSVSRRGGFEVVSSIVGLK